VLKNTGLPKKKLPYLIPTYVFILSIASPHRHTPLTPLAGPIHSHFNYLFPPIRIPKSLQLRISPIPISSIYPSISFQRYPLVSTSLLDLPPSFLPLFFSVQYPTLFCPTWLRTPPSLTNLPSSFLCPSALQQFLNQVHIAIYFICIQVQSKED